MEYLESKYLYLGLLLFSLAYPLAQSFERRLKYYRNFPALFKATGIMILLFIPWDIWFTAQGVWGFNPDYFMGLSIAGLPLEEWMFFIVVPFACVFIYEVLNYFFPKNILDQFSSGIGWLVSAVLLIGSLLNSDQLYPFVTFSLSAIAIVFATFKKPFWLANFWRMYVVSWIPFILVNGVLTGGLTENPVVNYNPKEILGLRVWTIPIEDSVYNLLMLLMVVFCYEYYKGAASKSTC